MFPDNLLHLSLYRPYAFFRSNTRHLWKAFSYLNIDEILMLNEIDENSLSYDQKNILNILFEKKTNYIDELV